MSIWVSGAATVRPASVPEPRDRMEARARMLMSPAALLASGAMRLVAEQAGWDETQRQAVGCFLGVGGSGGDPKQLERMLKASIVDGIFVMEREYQRGTKACSPLFMFQLMNNFSLCHGSILEGFGGPNGAFFSRGAGTVEALREAMFSIEEGSATAVVAGGADAGTYPVCLAELARGGWIEQGMVPADAAGMLALSHTPDARRIQVVSVDTTQSDVIDGAAPKSVLGVGWGPPAWAEIHGICQRSGWPPPSEIQGGALAASPAVAWVTAVSLLAPGEDVVVLSLGVDGVLGVVRFNRKN